MSLVIQSPGPGGLLGAVSDIELGKSHKLNVGKNEHPIYSTRIIEGKIEAIDWETNDSWSIIPSSGDSILEMLHVDAQLGGAFAVLSGSGERELHTDFVRTSNRITVRYLAFRSKYYKELNQPRIDAAVFNCGDGIDLLDKYGHGYISRIFYGATCAVTCIIEGDEAKDLEELAAELKTKIGVLPLSMRARAKLGYGHDKSKQTATASFEGKAVGVDVSFGVIETSEVVREFVARFIEAYENLDRTQMTPIAYELSRLDDLMVQASLSNQEISTMETNLGSCNKLLADAIYLNMGLSNMHGTLSDEVETFPHCKEELLPIIATIMKLRDKVSEYVVELYAYRGQQLQQIVQLQPTTIHELRPTSDFRRRVAELSGRGFLNEEETRQWLLDDSDVFPFGAALPQGMYYVGPVYTDVEKPKPMSTLPNLPSFHNASTGSVDSAGPVWKKMPFLRGSLFEKGDKLFKSGSVRELKTAAGREYANKEPPLGWQGWPQLASKAAAEKEILIEENEQLRTGIRMFSEKEASLLKENEQLQTRIKQLAEQAAKLVKRVGVGKDEAVHGFVLVMQDGRRVGNVLREDHSLIPDLNAPGDRITEWFEFDNEWIIRVHGHNSTDGCLCHTLCLTMSSGREIMIEPKSSGCKGSVFSYDAGTNRMITDMFFDCQGQVTGISANDVPAALSQKTLTKENERLHVRIRQLSVQLPPGVIVLRCHPYLALDVCRGKLAKGTNVFMWETNGSPAQQLVYNFDTGTITTRDDPNLCLDVYGGKFSPATNVQLWEANGSEGQQWDYDHESGIIALRHHPNLVMDVCGSKFARGTNVYIWRIKGSPAQQWTVVGR